MILAEVRSEIQHVLNPKEQRVFSYFYGQDDCPTQEEIADKMNLDRTSISHYLTKIDKKLSKLADGSLKKENEENAIPEEVKRRIIAGTYFLSSGCIDKYYTKAAQVRTLIIRDFEQAFAKCNVILSPTTPAPAFKIGANDDDVLKAYMGDMLTVPPSMAGLPALAVPAGKTKDGLTVGVQLIGPRRADALLLQLAADMEEAK